jgi:hypothetical protein
MDGNNLKRVELSDGNWVEVRTRINIADAEVFEQARLARDGKPSELLDSLAVFERLVKAWSYPQQITPQTIREAIAVEDLQTITTVIGEAQSPPTSAASSDGTPAGDMPETTVAEASQSYG